MTQPEHDLRPRLFAAWAERPLALACVFLAVTTLVWKTVGLEFVPGWDDMFGGVGAQYPRRAIEMSGAWKIGYLLVYGCLGTTATISGLLISLRRGSLESAAGAPLCRYAAVLGLFHVILGLHHTAWAITAGRWGHLRLEQFEVPGGYVLGALAGAWTGLHGLRLLSSRSESPTHRIMRSKIAVDGVSCLTFVSVVVCYARNALGLPRDGFVERVSWTLVFVGPVLWLVLDLAWSRRLPRSSATP
ncbi:MAG: hypothetical protein AAF196_17265 [Planctomycetota bacterium]